jgi:hypothetical protein
MAEKSFTADEFLHAVAEGSLAEPITREGVAKPDPGDPKAFLFSEGGSCGPWLKVPGEVVESVDFLRTVPCKDHEHPFVRLHLKEPKKDDPVGTFFADLHRRSQRTAPTLTDSFNFCISYNGSSANCNALGLPGCGLAIIIAPNRDVAIVKITNLVDQLNQTARDNGFDPLYDWVAGPTC